MEPNPFLSALKIGLVAVLTFIVFLSFWQSTHIETRVEVLIRENASLSDRVAEMGRKVDDLKSKADRVQGAADALSNALAGGLRLAPGDQGAAGPAKALPAATTSGWGWSSNAGLDANPDPSRPVGAVGRYKNFLSLDPEPEIPAGAAGHEDGVAATIYGHDPKGFNFVNENAAELTEYLKIYVAGAPCGEQWKNPYVRTPDLCWRVEVSPDYKEYTLFFRRDVVWHPPLVDLTKYPHLRGEHKVTAKDYKFTLDIIRNPQTNCANLRGYYTDISSVEVIDDYTLVVKWKETLWHSIAYTLQRELMPEFLFAYGEDGQRFPPETIGQQFNDHFYNQIGVCGCGPYRMVSYQRGQWITLERFDDWYGVREGLKYPIKTKKLLIYSDTETPFLKLQSGELDLCPMNAPQWRKAVIDNKDPKSPFNDGQITTYKSNRAVYLYFGWKNSNPLFKDRKVRKALALACNSEDMMARIFLGRFRRMSSPIYPESLQADPDLKPLPFDLAGAKELLDEAGWRLDPQTGKRQKEIDGSLKTLEFDMIWAAPSPDVEATLNQYKNDLLSIGVVMKPVPLEWNLWQKRAHDRDFEAIAGAWSTDGWDHDFDQIWHSRGIDDPGSSNYIEFRSPELDALSDDLRREMDVQKRIAKVKRIGRILYDEQPTCFFGWMIALGAYRSYLHNVTDHLYLTRPALRTFPMWVER